MQRTLAPLGPLIGNVRMSRKLLLRVLCMIVSASTCFAFFGYQDFDVPLCGGYYLWRKSAHQVDVSPQSHDAKTPIIPEKVIEISWDTRFVLAKRQATNKNHEPIPDHFDFWILDTKTPEVYGPLKKADFDEKRKKLDVPDSLELKDIYEFAPKRREIKF